MHKYKEAIGAHFAPTIIEEGKEHGNDKVRITTVGNRSPSSENKLAIHARPAEPC
jgi:hypothetical protein